MSADKATRKKLRQRPLAATTVVVERERPGPVDLVLIAVGIALATGIGYVAWRTQLRGEKLESVLPFLAADPAAKKPAPTAGSPSGELPEIRRTPADGDLPPPTRPGSKKTDPAENDPDNTYFGRRERHAVPAPTDKPR